MQQIIVRNVGFWGKFRRSLTKRGRESNEIQELGEQMRDSFIKQRKAQEKDPTLPKTAFIEGVVNC